MTRFAYESPLRLRDPHGRPYRARVYAEPGARMWDVWIEFVDEESGDLLLTGRETTQPDLPRVCYWASGLGSAYLEGAYRRAQRRSGGPIVEGLARRGARGSGV